MELLYLFFKKSTHTFVSLETHKFKQRAFQITLVQTWQNARHSYKTWLLSVIHLPGEPPPPTQCPSLSQLPCYCKAHPWQTEYIYNALQELAVATLLNCVQFALPPPPPGVYFHLVGIALLRLGSRRPRSHKTMTGTRLPSCPHLPNIYAAKVNVIPCVSTQTTCSVASQRLLSCAHTVSNLATERTIWLEPCWSW